MLHIYQRPRRLCDGVARRQFLSLGTLSYFGFSLRELWRSEAAAAAPQRRGKARSCILIWLQGGPSQIDTFDPKPDAPAEVRGPFDPIDTNVAGIRIAEPFPRLARMADRYALLRSVSHPVAEHGQRGHEWMLCGRSVPGIAYPSMAAVISKLRGGGSLLPRHVAVPNLAYFSGHLPSQLGQTGGFLGDEYGPVVPEGELGSPELRLPNVDAPAGIDVARRGRRRTLLAADPFRLGSTGAGRSQDALYQKAFNLIDSGGMRQAFDLSREPGKLRDRYGRNPVGACALLARRLVEQDVRFVTLNWPNYFEWDNHADIEGAIGNHLGPTLDRALSTLLDDLQSRGLLESTLVVAMGEMGRTPKMGGDNNPIYTNGRGHWGGVMSVFLAGGGVRGGQAIGSSDEQGAYPASRTLKPQDVVASIYHAFGITTDDTIPSPGGRPVRVLDEGEPIRELF